MEENRLKVYQQLERINTLSSSAAHAYYRLAMQDDTWQKRVEFINLTIDSLRATIDELEEMAK